MKKFEIIVTTAALESQRTDNLWLVLSRGDSWVDWRDNRSAGRKWIMALAPWCAMRKREAPAHPVVCDDAGIQSQGRAVADLRSTRISAELHAQAFRRLGGSVQVVVLDHLREGVLTPDIYEPTLNPLYVICWPTMAPWPCPVEDPDRKGKVEAGAGHAQRTPLKAQRFESLAQAPSLSRSLGAELG